MDSASSTTGHYTVLARRFRPQTFDEVIGQQHVARALQNAIRHGRVAHAYLFTGARGVGKTSMARILAKALNCPNAEDGRPCNECEVCRSISAGHDVDVMEIDGASNRGIDDVRQLRANVNVKSMRSRYKIYIIDEVHMLTTDAFNALLKTLEEPPPNVKFVFCTTEPDKLLDTILSRCQRFDFASIETQNIVQRLAEIAAAEGFDVEPEALELVARRAGGSMRDSQSLFDQVLAFAEGTVTAADIHRLLGTASDDRLIALATALVARDRAAALKELDASLAGGVQLGEFTDQLLRYLRDLMLLASGAEGVPLLSVSEGHRDALRGQAEMWGVQTVVAALQILSEAKSQMNRVSYGRVLAELALVRISLLEDLEDLDALIRGLRDGQGAAAVTARTSKKNGAPAPSPNPAKSASQPATQSPAPSASQAAAPREKKKPGDDPPPAITVADTRDETLVLVKVEAGRERDILAQIVKNLELRLQSHVGAADSLAIIGPKHLELSYTPSYDFSRRLCEKPENLGLIERVARRVTGSDVQITIRDTTPEPQTAAAAPQRRTVPDEGVRKVSLDEAEQQPFVGQLASVFGAKVVSVQSLQGTGKTTAHSSHPDDREPDAESDS